MGYEFFTALTPYLLVTGGFTLVLLKTFKGSFTLIRFYVLIYLVGSFLMTLITHLKTIEGGVLYYTVGGFPPPLGITYVSDKLSSSLALLVSSFFLVLYPLLFTFKLSVDEYFLALYLGLEAGFLGVLYTGDLFNMFVMIEVILIATYGLIALSRTSESYVSVLRYIFVAGLGGIVFFAGVVLIYFATGTLNIAHLAKIFDGVETGYTGYSPSPGKSILILSVLLFWGLMIDEALAPLHFWLPGAYSSSHPVIASLLAGASEGVAYYALIRIFYTIMDGFPLTTQYALRILGILTVMVGGAGMIYSRRLSGIISYSVILDSGYIAIALSLGRGGVSIALFYVISHMIVKPLLFLLAGWAREQAGDDKLEDLTGVFRSSRIFQAGLITGALAVVGMPPTVLFAAKLQLYIGLLNTAELNLLDIIALVALLVGSALSLASFIKVVSTTILMPPSLQLGKPPALLQVYALAFLTLTVVWGISYTLLQQVIVVPASTSLIDGRSTYIEKVLEALFRGG